MTQASQDFYICTECGHRAYFPDVDAQAIVCPLCQCDVVVPLDSPRGQVLRSDYPDADFDYNHAIYVQGGRPGIISILKAQRYTTREMLSAFGGGVLILLSLAYMPDGVKLHHVLYLLCGLVMVKPTRDMTHFWIRKTWPLTVWRMMAIALFIIATILAVANHTPRSQRVPVPGHVR